MIGNPYYPSYPQTFQPQQGMLVGKTVRSADDVRPNDVPMDGSIGYFPVEDGESIVRKRWTSDGTIETTVYVKSDDISVETAETEISTIMRRLDEIDGKLESLL